MESAQIQLVFNVIAITGVSSLASLWYLRKKDRMPVTATPSSIADAPVEPAVSAPVPAEIIHAEIIHAEIIHAEIIQQDVRQFAANRRSTWVSRISAAPDGSF